jgi:hypothetical protein
MPGERSAFAINAATAEKLRQTRAGAWNQLSPDAKRARVRETIGARSPADLPPPAVATVGTVKRAGATVHKLVLSGDSGIRLPALAFVPDQPAGPATLYLHGTSMAEDAGPGGPIDALLKQGHVVLAAELRGIGETETSGGGTVYGRGRFGRDNSEVFIAYLIGRSYVGLRVEDVQSWTRVLRDYRAAGSAPSELHLVGIGEAAIPALHAAALQGGDFRSVTLRRMVRSWEDVVRASENVNQTVNMVHGALRHYDLPDLGPLAETRSLRILEPVDPTGVVLRD